MRTHSAPLRRPLSIIALASSLILGYLPERSPATAQKTGRRAEIVGAGAVPVASLPTGPKRFALLVGVDKYQDGQLTPLSGAANDAHSLANALVEHAGFPRQQVVLLTTDQPVERQPTRSNIIRHLANLRQTVPADGLLLFFFAGHGVERDRRAYLLPLDGQVGGDAALTEDSAIDVDSMREHIRRTGVRQVLVILDACRSNLMSARGLRNQVRLSRSFTRGFNFASRNRGVIAFATLYATGMDQSAYEYAEKRRGFFTWALVEGLAGDAADSRDEVTLASLLSYVQKKVPLLTSLYVGGGVRQQPFAVVEGFKADALVVAVARRAARAGPNADDERQDTQSLIRVLTQRRLAFAAGAAVAMLGQSSRNVGGPLFERSLRGLNLPADSAGGLVASYGELNGGLGGMSYEAAQGEKYALLLGVKGLLREGGGGEYAAYVDLGPAVCFLLLLLKFWDRLPAGESRRLVAFNALLAVVRGSEGVSLTAPLAESLRSAKGLGVDEEGSRESLRRVLSEVLNHFDVSPR